MKTKKILKIILSIAIISTLVGYTKIQSRTVFPGGAYITQNGISKGVYYGKFCYVEDNQVYFTMYDETKNITEYCSSETYFVDQVQIGNYRQTIIIGGDLDSIGVASEFGFIGDKIQGDGPHFETNGKPVVGSRHYTLSSPYYESDNPPIWLENATNDYDIDFLFHSNANYN